MLKLLSAAALVGMVSPAFAQQAAQPSAEAQMYAVAAAAQETTSLRAQLYDMSKQLGVAQQEIKDLQSQIKAKPAAAKP